MLHQKAVVVHHHRHQAAHPLLDTHPKILQECLLKTLDVWHPHRRRNHQQRLPMLLLLPLHKQQHRQQERHLILQHYHLKHAAHAIKVMELYHRHLRRPTITTAPLHPPPYHPSHPTHPTSNLTLIAICVTSSYSPKHYVISRDEPERLANAVH